MSSLDGLPPIAVEFVRAMAEFMTENDGARPTRCDVSREALADIRAATGSHRGLDGLPGAFFDVMLYDAPAGTSRFAMSTRRSPAGEREWLETAAGVEPMLRSMLGLDRD